jgi:MFS transporter, putative metabolite:H+ symporter
MSSVMPTDTSFTDRARLLSARIDRLRTTRLHILWIVILGLGYLIETFDNTVFAYVAPAIRAQWHLSIGGLGVITSAVFYGTMAGGVVGGRLLDRFGRKQVLIWSSVWYSAASVLCALAPNLATLFAGRVLTGIGVQAATGAVLVYVSEMFPRLSRGRFFTAVVFFGYVGAPATSFTAAAIAPSGPGAWRWVFALGSAGILIAVAVAAGLPETVRWLSLRGRLAEGELTVARLESLDQRRGPLDAIGVAADVKPGSFRQLLRPKHARRLLVVTLAFGGMLYCQYGFTAYLPTMLVGGGMPEARALHTASIITLGTLGAAPVMLLVSDRIERKSAMLVAAIFTGAALWMFGAASSTAELIAFGLLIYTGLAALVTSFYNYIPEIFPTDVRGVGTGIVGGVGRLAGVVSSLTVAAMYINLGVATLFVVMAVIAVAAGLLVFTLGPRTTRRSLESISAE